MRIGINAFPLRANGGGARYAFAGLLSALLDAEDKHRYLIFVHLESIRLVYQILKAHGETLGGVGPDPRVKVIRIQDEGQIYGHRYDFDLLFGPLNNLNPRLYDRPTVAILHDIQEHFFPEYFAKSDLLARQEVYPEICRAATTLVAISEFCKTSFIEKFGINPDKIEVVPNAPQAQLVSAPGDGVWGRAALPTDFLFYPANCYRHKNHTLLLDAVAKLRSEGRQYPTVFSGYEMPGGFPLRKEIASRGLGDICQVFTDLPAEELRYLYRHAKAVVLPTRFEGFGMPAIEAAACGRPVACSDIPALREVLGDAALYFSPDSVDDLCAKIRQITSDENLRQQLIDGGHQRAARFTWENSAKRMLEVFEQARERFAWGNHRPNSIKRPRIGVMLRLNHNGLLAIPTVESLLCNGYDDLVIRCEELPVMTTALRDFLKSAGVELVKEDGFLSDSTSSNGSVSEHAQLHHAEPGYASLRQFAGEHDLDMVGEVIEGHKIKISGLDSIAWAYLTAPDLPVHIAESMEWRGKQFVGTSRLRLTGDGLWKLEGYLYPEMLFLNPRAMEAWPEGLEKALHGGSEWRWELLRFARREGKLFHSRRTIADTDKLLIGGRNKRRAAKAGMFDYYTVDSEHSVKVRMLRRVQPLVKRASLMLPMKWQDAGTRLWYHLAR